MRTSNLRGLRAPRPRIGGGSLFLGLVGVGLGLTLLAKPSKEPEASSERVSPDELPDPDDFRQQLAAVGLDPNGQRLPPPALPEAAQRLEVIDVAGQSVAEPTKQAAPT